MTRPGWAGPATTPTSTAGTATDAYARVCDATAHGLPGGANVDGSSGWTPPTSTCPSPAPPRRCRGLGTVQDEDVVYYNGGTWSVYFDGTAHGLTTANLDVDAFDVP